MSSYAYHTLKRINLNVEAATFCTSSQDNYHKDPWHICNITDQCTGSSDREIEVIN